MRGRVALGFRTHSGWAAMVAVRDPVEAPLVVQRRRVELIDHRVAGAKQPYHAAEKMPLSEAEAFINECAEVSAALACKAVRAAIDELTLKGYVVRGSCVLLGSGRESGSLAATLASHTMIHTAEGNFFREVLKTACESCGLEVVPVKEKAVWDRAVAALGRPRAELESCIAELGKSVGPPWTQDEKLSALAGWLVLAASAESNYGPGPRGA